MATKKYQGMPTPQSLTEATERQRVSRGRFLVVGIGASVDEQEVFEQFFHPMSSDSDMVFIPVPHLDPGHHKSSKENAA